MKFLITSGTFASLSFYELLWAKCPVPAYISVGISDMFPYEQCSANWALPELLAHLIFLFILQMGRDKRWSDLGNKWVVMPLRALSMQVFLWNWRLHQVVVLPSGWQHSHLLQCLVWKKTCRPSQWHYCTSVVYMVAVNMAEMYSEELPFSHWYKQWYYT